MKHRLQHKEQILFGLLSVFFYYCPIVALRIHWDKYLSFGLYFSRETWRYPLQVLVAYNQNYLISLLCIYSLYGIVLIFVFLFYCKIPQRLSLTSTALKRVARKYRRWCLFWGCSMSITIWSLLFTFPSGWLPLPARVGIALFTILLSCLFTLRTIRSYRNQLSEEQSHSAATTKKKMPPAAIPTLLLSTIVSIAHLLLSIITPMKEGITDTLTLLISPQTSAALHSIFIIRNGYDMAVSLIPLLGTILLLSNLKYNAPQSVGRPIREGIHHRTIAYTLVKSKGEYT